jgi:hypothetical protein
MSAVQTRAAQAATVAVAQLLAKIVVAVVANVRVANVQPGSNSWPALSAKMPRRAR